MSEIGLWDVSKGKPERYERGTVELEQQLEEWIEADPTLIDANLLIVGRQVRLDGGRLDLLGYDGVGRWVVIEIKRGNVRRETITQAVDYAACIKDMSPDELMGLVENYLKRQHISLSSFLKKNQLNRSIFEEREMLIYVVGTGRDANLERMARFLSTHGIPVNVLNIEVFENAGQRLLLRNLTELEIESYAQATTAPAKKLDAQPAAESELERLFRLADTNGVGESFRRVYEVATKHGLYPRMFKWSIMYTPPQNKTRVLICAWVKPVGGKLDMYVNSPGFAEFYPISAIQAVRIMGIEKRASFTQADVEAFLVKLEKLFAQTAKNS